VRDTLGNADGRFGDGVAVVKVHDASTATLSGMLIDHSTRRASRFRLDATLSSSTLECNAIQLDVEECVDPSTGIFDSGGVVCGCDGASVECAAVSSTLEPPTPLRSRLRRTRRLRRRGARAASSRRGCRARRVVGIGA